MQVSQNATLLPLHFVGVRPNEAQRIAKSGGICVRAVPHGDSAVSVDVLDGLDVRVQLRVAVQVSGTAPL